MVKQQIESYKLTDAELKKFYRLSAAQYDVGIQGERPRLVEIIYSRVPGDSNVRVLEGILFKGTKVLSARIIPFTYSALAEFMANNF